eukprot:4763642-Prymnesium_polylepis.1
MAAACADGLADVAYRDVSVQVSASSAENEYRAAVLAIDGKDETRWGSLFKDEQWLQVDLDQSYAISSVEILWEAALPLTFEVQICSADGLAACQEPMQRRRAQAEEEGESAVDEPIGQEEGESSVGATSTERGTDGDEGVVTGNDDAT